MKNNKSEFINIGKYPEILLENFPESEKRILDETPGLKFLSMDNEYYWFIEKASWDNLFSVFSKFGISKKTLPFLIFLIEVLHRQYWFIKKRYEKDIKNKSGRAFNELKKLSELYKGIKSKDLRIKEINISFDRKDKKGVLDKVPLNEKFSINVFIDFMDAFNKTNQLLGDLPEKENPNFHYKKVLAANRNVLVREAYECLEIFLNQNVRQKFMPEHLSYIHGWLCSFAKIFCSEQYFDENPSKFIGYKTIIESMYTPFERYLKKQIKNILRPKQDD